MSYAQLIGIFPGTQKETKVLVELRNSHGFCPVVWDELSQRWLGTEPHRWLLGDDKALWKLATDPRLPIHQRAVMAMTYDNAYIKRSDFARAASDLRAWLVDFPKRDGYVNHIEQMAEVFETDPKVPAIGIYGTSVGENLWERTYHDYGNIERRKRFDWSSAWDLYDALDKPVEAASR